MPIKNEMKNKLWYIHMMGYYLIISFNDTFQKDPQIITTQIIVKHNSRWRKPDARVNTDFIYIEFLIVSSLGVSLNGWIYFEKNLSDMTLVIYTLFCMCIRLKLNIKKKNSSTWRVSVFIAEHCNTFLNCIALSVSNTQVECVCLSGELPFCGSPHDPQNSHYPLLILLM